MSRWIAFVVVVSAGVLAGCANSHRSTGDGGLACSDGAQQCAGSVRQICTGGQFQDVETCAMACDDMLGCVACVPGTGTCDGDTSHACTPDGSGYEDVYCDPLQGMTCGTSGVCEGACSLASLGQTYLGCDYWPTVTGNPVASGYDFAVVVSNTTASDAQVTIDGGALTSAATFTVPANNSVVHNLPWVNSLKVCANNTSSFTCTSSAHQGGALAAAGAYHLRATAPVTVYQFNPIEYTKAGVGENSFTNDASLLFPTTAWRTDHYVATWNQTGNVHPSLLAVTSYRAGTQVTITTRANTAASGGAPAFVAGTPQMVTLGAGDVLQLGTPNGDLTGSRVQSDQPVQVIGGHYCANIPDGFGFCDHLEEVMLPVDILGANYVINAPAVTTIPNGKEEMVRIVATEANTTLTYDPAQAGAPTTIANPGDFVQISRQAASYLLHADKKVLVAQFMEGSTVAGNTGDPAMALAVPVEQFRNQYLFHAPTNYQTNYVDITAPVGATVLLDGTAVGTWTAIGTSGWQLARITPLGNGPNNDGNHSIIGDMGFGISVYGYGQDTSYWYPGGLDLKQVVIQ
jgi:IgGFc binding protein